MPSIDTKQPSFNRADLARACANTGIAFDPKGYDVPEAAYLQIVGKGIVDIGIFDAVSNMLRTGNLTESMPPVENIVALKLLRASEKDVEDIVFLMAATDTRIDSVVRAIGTLEEKHRETTLENLALVALLLKEENQCPK
jgi:hypothetical protein